MEAAEGLLAFWIGGSLISGMTWFFSSRPRLFIWVFVPRDEWRGAIQLMVRDRGFGLAMQKMALLQFSVAVVLGLIGLWLRFR